MWSTAPEEHFPGRSWDQNNIYERFHCYPLPGLGCKSKELAEEPQHVSRRYGNSHARRVDSRGGKRVAHARRGRSRYRRSTGNRDGGGQLNLRMRCRTNAASSAYGAATFHSSAAAV